MVKIFLRLSVCTLTAWLICGCSSYNKLLKSHDHEKMYHAALDFYKAKKYQRVLQLFEEIDPYFAGTLRDDTIKFYTAAATYNSGDFEVSGILFDQFRRQFRTSPFLQEAEYMYAMGYYYSSPQPERDQTNTIKAIIAINEYLDRYPDSVKKDDLDARIVELQRKLFDKEYLNAKSYYTTGKYKSAVVALRNSVDQNPESPHREEMMYLVTKSGYLLAEHSIEELQKDRYLKMMDYYLNFTSEFPDSKYSRELGKMMDAAKKYLAKHNTEPTDTQENTTPQDGTEKE